MLKSTPLIRTTMVMLALITSIPCKATNGSFNYAYGTINEGLGGAGVALPQDTLSMAINPAGIIALGKRVDLDGDLFFPQRGYTASSVAPPVNFAVAEGPHTSSNPVFLLPAFGFVEPFGNPENALGVSIYANGGMNTHYSTDDLSFSRSAPTGSPGVFGDNPTGIDLKQLFTNFTYAHAFNQKFSAGISFITALQTLSVDGTAPFAPFSNDSSALSNNGFNSSLGVGGEAGILFQPWDRLSLGASYRSKIAARKMDRYAGLLPNNGSFDIPSTAIAGLAIKATSNVDALFDAEEIWFSDVPTYHSNINALTGCLAGNQGQCLGGVDGPGFGWRNATIYKAGLQLHGTDGLTWRAGYSIVNNIIPAKEVTFNIFAPAAVRDHYTLGVTKDFNHKYELSASAMYAPKQSVIGQNAFQPNQSIKVHLEEYNLGVGFSWLL